MDQIEAKNQIAARSEKQKKKGRVAAGNPGLYKKTGKLRSRHRIPKREKKKKGPHPSAPCAGEEDSPGGRKEKQMQLVWGGVRGGGGWDLFRQSSLFLGDLSP